MPSYRHRSRLTGGILEGPPRLNPVEVSPQSKRRLPSLANHSPETHSGTFASLTSSLYPSLLWEFFRRASSLAFKARPFDQPRRPDAARQHSCYGQVLSPFALMTGTDESSRLGRAFYRGCSQHLCSCAFVDQERISHTAETGRRNICRVHLLIRPRHMADLLPWPWK